MPDGILDQRVLKYRNFGKPRVSLLVLKGMVVGPSELTEDRLVWCPEKSDDRSIKVGVSHRPEFQSFRIGWQPDLQSIAAPNLPFGPERQQCHGFPTYTARVL
jgi:hypothetical protein